VKIKITEYFPGAVISADQKSAMDALSNNSLFFPSSGGGGGQPLGVLTPVPAPPERLHPVASGQKIFIIQRVNGNGGNGKTDGIEGGHRHTLEDSDKVKKNSVHRYLLKKTKDEKKEVVSLFFSIVHSWFTSLLMAETRRKQTPSTKKLQAKPSRPLRSIRKSAS
jgi:glutathione S-transferase